jgi:hypothetical protein
MGTPLTEVSDAPIGLTLFRTERQQVLKLQQVHQQQAEQVEQVEQEVQMLQQEQEQEQEHQVLQHLPMPELRSNASGGSSFLHCRVQNQSEHGTNVR